MKFAFAPRKKRHEGLPAPAGGAQVVCHGHAACGQKLVGVGRRPVGGVAIGRRGHGHALFTQRQANATDRLAVEQHAHAQRLAGVGRVGRERQVLELLAQRLADDGAPLDDGCGTWAGACRWLPGFSIVGMLTIAPPSTLRGSCTPTGRWNETSMVVHRLTQRTSLGGDRSATFRPVQGAPPPGGMRMW